MLLPAQPSLWPSLELLITALKNTENSLTPKSSSLKVKIAGEWGWRDEKAQQPRASTAPAEDSGAFPAP